VNPLYLLDTCILSEPVKPHPSTSVLERLEACGNRLAMPAIVWHELLYGVQRLPSGKRKQRLNAYLFDVLQPTVPIIAYDNHAAWIHADIRTRLVELGRTPSFADGQIAAIALAGGMVLVTRNEKDFSDIPLLTVVNWFSEQLVSRAAGFSS
jgi:tRNA(fMet)-specific endonuclease VapC